MLARFNGTILFFFYTVITVNAKFVVRWILPIKTRWIIKPANTLINVNYIFNLYLLKKVYIFFFLILSRLYDKME